MIGMCVGEESMIDFLRALSQYTFLQNALLAGVLAGIACGVVGTWVVVRRISYMAGGIAHASLAGLGVAHYLSVVYQWSWAQPLYGAALSALAAAVTIGLVSLYAKEREDTVIGAIWAIGMAVGILFISQTPGYSSDLMSYLFGNILMVSEADLWLIVILDTLIISLTWLFFAQLAAISFDEEFARVRGLPTRLYFLLLLALVALTVVTLVTVVGIVMVIALLTIPAAIANRFTHRLRSTMILATGISVALTSLGLALSYGPDLPSGAVIILLTGVVYLAVVFSTRRQRS
jgi:zinc transport system permease protein